MGLATDGRRVPAGRGNSRSQDERERPLFIHEAGSRFPLSASSSKEKMKDYRRGRQARSGRESPVIIWRRSGPWVGRVSGIVVLISGLYPCICETASGTDVPSKSAYG
ncbi:hypothetical protein NDU88_006436 [Pleurodeles waltl]|uniref:Uncharacterized protein n=1 Tax=Pleurodeles waltl TaxID=8319 RepID=A0AAV7SPL6_PLEWA|nr:hypothetical protein NDU88_006436 [Pleurodeles waltl]